MGEGVPASQSAVKIGTEGTWGDGGADTLIPVTGVSVASVHENILDQGLRGFPARDFGAYQGPSRAEVSLEGLAFEEALSPLAACVIGGAVVSSSPSSLTVAVSDGGIAAYEASGLLVSELSIRFSAAEGAVTYSASLVGKEIASIGAFGGPGIVEDPFVGWMAAGPANLIEGEWTFSREIGLLYTGGGATGYLPTNAYAGPLEVTARATYDIAASSLIADFLNKVQSSYTVTFTNPDTAGTLAIAASKMDICDGPFEVDRTGVFVTVAFSMRALVDLPADDFVTITFG